MLDEMLVEGVGDGRQGDGGTGVAASSLLNRVGRQDLAMLMARSSSSVSLNSVMDVLPSNTSGTTHFAYAAPCMPSHCNPILTL